MRGWLLSGGSNAITGWFSEKKNYPVTIWYQRVRFVEDNSRFREAVADLTTFVNLLVSLFSVGAGNFE